MQRRSFIKQSILWTAGCAVGSRMPLWGSVSVTDEMKGTVLRPVSYINYFVIHNLFIVRLSVGGGTGIR